MQSLFHGYVKPTKNGLGEVLSVSLAEPIYICTPAYIAERDMAEAALLKEIQRLKTP